VHRLLREAIGFLSNIIVNSIFVNPSAPHRRASALSKVLFLASAIFAFYEFPSLGLVVAAEILIIYVLSTGDLVEPASMFVLSSIPALWMAATSVPFLAFSGSLSSYKVFEIFYKTLFYSLFAILAAGLITPRDLSRITYVFTRKVAFPHLLWSLIPSQLKDATVSLNVQEMKGTPLSSSLFAVFSEQLERADQIMIANYPRLESKVKRLVKGKENEKFTFAFFVVFSINVALALIAYFYL
jgi:hypothetical protein